MKKLWMQVFWVKIPKITRCSVVLESYKKPLCQIYPRFQAILIIFRLFNTFRHFFPNAFNFKNISKLNFIFYKNIPLPSLGFHSSFHLFIFSICWQLFNWLLFTNFKTFFQINLFLSSSHAISSDSKNTSNTFWNNSKSKENSQIINKSSVKIKNQYY